MTPRRVPALADLARRWLPSPGAGRLALAGTLAATLATALAPGAAPASAAAPAAPPDATLRAGKKVFGEFCVECHGPTGVGDGKEAKRKNFHPRNFTTGAFKCRCTPSGEPPSDEDLLRTVSTGLPGTPMPAFPGLSMAEKTAVVQYVKSFAPRAFAAGNRSSCPTAATPPTATPELVSEGRQLYRLMQCSKCHGASGRGDGPAAASLRDDWGQPAEPYNFVAYKSFKCGNADADLFRTLTTGMTGAPMPSFASALTFGRDAFPEESIRALGTPAESAELARYLAAQPTGAQIAAMSDAQRQTLSDRRGWALVRYVRSLLTP